LFKQNWGKLFRRHKGAEIRFHVFLNSALIGAEWSSVRTDHFASGQGKSVTIGQEAGWTPDPAKRKIPLLPGM
jgi:hypothetical protein